MGKQRVFLFLFWGWFGELVSIFFLKYIYIHSASLSKEVVLQMTELPRLQQTEYLDLSSRLSIQKW